MRNRWKGLFMVVFASVTVFTFSNRQASTNTTVKSKFLETEPKTFTMLIGGDIMLGRTVTSEALDRFDSPDYPFTMLASTLKSVDVVFLNLENPIINNCPRREEGMIFCAPPEMLSGLTINDNTVVNLSNNHTLNYGEAGYEETKQHLSNKQIHFADHETLHIEGKNGKTYGFLGFEKSQQSNPLLTESEEQIIKDSSKKVDFLVVAMHWGIEYNAHPTEGQRKLANRLVELGVDLIVGHHPHWMQDTEVIGKVPVYYSLGNLIFDQMWSEETRKGLIVKLTLNGTKIIKEEKIPIYIQYRGQPIILP